MVYKMQYVTFNSMLLLIFCFLFLVGLIVWNMRMELVMVVEYVV